MLTEGRSLKIGRKVIRHQNGEIVKWTLRSPKLT